MKQKYIKIKKVVKENKLLTFYILFNIISLVILLVLGGITLFNIGIMIIIVLCSKMFIDLINKIDDSDYLWFKKFRWDKINLNIIFILS